MSQAGFWFYADAPGNPLRAGPDSATVILTNVVTTGTTSGFVTDPMFSLGLPIIFSALPVSGDSSLPPDITFDTANNRLVWTFDGGSGQSHFISYGVRS